MEARSVEALPSGAAQVLEMHSADSAAELPSPVAVAQATEN